MATETFKYFKPESANLRSEYGGGAILAGGDTREVDGKTLTHRYLSKKLGVPANGTRFLWEVGTATDTFTWVKVSDFYWASVSPFLTAAETATVQSTAPAGFAKASVVTLLQPSATRKWFMMRGSSLLFGLGTTTGDTRDTWPAQLINSISGQTLSWVDSTYTEGTSDSYYLGSLSLGSSSWGNTNSGGGVAVYPQREDLAFAQRTQTLPLLGRNGAFLYSLGTNDLAYDTSLTGADVWARTVARINAFRAEFPNVKLALETVYKRSEVSALNTRINDYNVLMRANYASVGVDKLFDSEAKVSQVNVTTGNTANTTYYTDGTHLTTLTHGLIAAAHKQDFIDLLNAA